MRIKSTTLLGVTFMVLAALALSTFGWLSYSRYRTEMGDSMRKSGMLLCSALAHEISTYLDLHATVLKTAAGRIDVDPGAFAAVKQSFSASGRIILLNERGRVVFPSDSADYGYDLSYREFFDIPWRYGRTYVSASFIEEQSYFPTSVVSLKVGNFVVAGYLTLNSLDSYVQGLPSMGSGSVAVIDRNGYFIAHQEGQRVSQRRSAGLEPWFQGRSFPGSMIIGSGGQATLVSWSPVNDSSGWTVIHTQSLEAFTVTGTVMFQSVVLIIVLYLGVAAVAVVLLLRLARHDMDRLLANAASIAEGDYGPHPGAERFSDYMELSQRFESMANALGEREQTVRENETRLRAILDFIPVPGMILDDSGRLLLVNRAMQATFGWDLEDLPDMDACWVKLYPDPGYRANVMSNWTSYLDKLGRTGRQPENFKGVLRCKDGSNKLVQADAAMIADRTVVVYVDVTDSTRAAETLRQSLAEKEVLLKEIHHRVKNNLQMVISLLSLQAGVSVGPDGRHPFSDSVDRIQVMSSIHELLYQSNDLSHVYLNEFAGNIAQWLLSTAPVGAVPELLLDVQKVPLTIDQAIPCGLMLNEMLTNSLKYAFDEFHPNPQLRVGAWLENGRLTLQAGDNGKGLPPAVDPATSDSLGMQLIVSLCSQLGADWKLSREGGTTWRVTFSLDEL
ncbi:MAG: PAS domain S-box protein [Spirochaetales bacterium]|nr:PAS domain S-box protein [Spirochaetales bacterium]